MSFFKQTGYLGVGLVLSGVGGLILNIGLARVLPGPEYGKFRLFFSSILIVGWVLAFGIERDLTSRLSADESTAGTVGRIAVTVGMISVLFVSLSVLLQPTVSSLLGDKLFVPFVLGGLSFLYYRSSMGMLKGFKLMKNVGVQNAFVGVGKVAIVGGAVAVGWQAFEVSASLVGVYLAVTLVSSVWLSSHVQRVAFERPARRMLQSIMQSTTKQFGDVVVKFGGPIIVTLFGGTAFESGLFAGALTLAFIPFYGYNAIVNTILPVISELNSENEREGIGQRIGFLFEISVTTLVFWTGFGALVGTDIVQVVYGQQFQLSIWGATLIFFIASAVIISSLLTEILIGLNLEQAVARGWTVPLIILPAGLIVPGDPIGATGTILSLYVCVVTVSLANALKRSDTPIRWTGFDHTVFN